MKIRTVPGTSKPARVSVLIFDLCYFLSLSYWSHDYQFSIGVANKGSVVYGLPKTPTERSSFKHKTRWMPLTMVIRWSKCLILLCGQLVWRKFQNKGWSRGGKALGAQFKNLPSQIPPIGNSFAIVWLFPGWRVVRNPQPNGSLCFAVLIGFVIH